jgi:hypothetical protein
LGRDAVKIGKYVSIVLLVVLALFGGLARSANASLFKKSSHSPRAHYRMKKNLAPYGGNYLAPKKQHRPSGTYRSQVTGQTLYGKPVKPKP